MGRFLFFLICYCLVATIAGLFFGVTFAVLAVLL